MDNARPTTPLAPAAGDLRWVLSLLEDWLLIAEPGTVRELAAFLHTTGSTATTGDVLTLLARLRQLISDPPS